MLVMSHAAVKTPCIALTRIGAERPTSAEAENTRTGPVTRPLAGFDSAGVAEAEKPASPPDNTESVTTLILDACFLFRPAVLPWRTFISAETFR